MQMPIKLNLTQTKSRIVANARLLAGILLIMFVIEVVDTFLPLRLSLDRFGIIPRYVPSLLDIPLAPWLHAGFGHLMGNAVPFFFLGLLISLTSVRRLAVVTAFSAVVGGLGTFFMGAAGTNHIGASGVVAGYLGYLVARGFMEKRVMAIIVSVAVGLYFALRIVGLLMPTQGVSWTGHFFGMLGGVAAAWYCGRSGRELGASGSSRSLADTE